jgi:YbbR domain-containing protein
MALEIGARLKSAVTENFNLKALSLAFALVLYSLFHGQEEQRWILVNVAALAPPEGGDRVLQTPVPPNVRVTLRGPKSILDELRADDIGSIQVDLHKGTETRVTFEPRMVHVPAGVKVEQIDPPAIDLQWEDRVVRDVPVQVSVVGSPAPGFVVKGTPVSDPATVRARGPKSEAMVLQHARADAFDVTGLTEGKHTRTLRLDTAPGRVTYEVPSVTVTLEIAREVSERPYTKVPIAITGQPHAKAQPPEVDVRLTCPPEILRGLRLEQIVPRVQVTSTADKGSEALPVQLTVEGCEVHLTPSTVVVRWGT